MMCVGVCAAQEAAGKLAAYWIKDEERSAEQKSKRN